MSAEQGRRVTGMPGGHRDQEITIEDKGDQEYVK